LVLRRYVLRRVTDEEPEAPAREIAGMARARAHGVPAPDVLAVDLDGVAIGDGIPAVLMSQLPGRSEAVPDVARLAEIAASIHAVTPVGCGYEYAPWCRDTCTRPPTAATKPKLWDRAIELWHTAQPPAAPAFIHRDLHPGNVLWSHREVTGVVDWVNACIGPAGVDVATCRWNLADWAGLERADAFVTAYERYTNSAHHPYWDLASLLEDDYDLEVAPEHVAAVESHLASVVPRLLRA
jgi:Ser/Thr protein kinase RdoA (MazF antagonist)